MKNKQLTLKIDWFNLMEMGLIDCLNDYVKEHEDYDWNYYVVGYTPIGVEGRDIVFQVDFELDD
jgi:hypothetical protein